MGWLTAWAHVILDDVVTVPFKSSGHKSRDDAMQVVEKIDKEKAIRVQFQVIIQIDY